MKIMLGIASVLLIAPVGCGDSLTGPDALEYVVEGRLSQTQGEPLVGVKVSAYGLDSDRFSYEIASVLTDSEGMFSLRWRGSATSCPEAFPGLRPPGYHVTATKVNYRGAFFTAVCGKSPIAWMVRLGIIPSCGLCPSFSALEARRKE